jgi:porin
MKPLHLVLLSTFIFSSGPQLAHASTNLFPGPDQQTPGAFNPYTATSNGPEGLTQEPESLLNRSNLLGDLNDWRNQLMYRGVSLSPSYIGEVMGNVSGGTGRGVIYDGVFNLGLDVDLERATDWWKDGLIHGNLLWIYGTSLSTRFTGDFSNTSNVAGYNTIRLQELWYQQGFWDKRASLRIGLLAADAEFFGSSFSALFLNGTFGAFTLVGANLPNAPIYPMAAPGIRFAIQPVSKFYFQAGIYDGDTESQDENNHGTAFRLSSRDGAVIFSEVGFLLNQSPGERGLTGTYKLGSFVHTNNFPTFDSQAREALGIGGLKNEGVDWGIYGVADQELYHAGGKTVGLFVRGGGAPGNVNFVNWYIDGGLNFTGFIPGRFRDVAGIAVAHSSISQQFSDSEVLQGNAPYTSETVLEATYRINITPWWTLQPDIQYIWTPSGEKGSKDALVFGARTVVTF